MPTNPSHNYQALLDAIKTHAPSHYTNADLPLTISQQEAEVVLHVVHDVGGQLDGPLDKTLHKVALWEKNTHCTA